MATSPTSDELDILRRAVRGDGARPGLALVLPRLQVEHRKELRTRSHWSKEELVRHPEPRELIRSMRKPGNQDTQGRPVYTLDERRSLTADIYENRMVRGVVDSVRARLVALAATDVEAGALLYELNGAIARAPFLADVSPPARASREPTATLTRDPLYRAVLACRV